MATKEELLARLSECVLEMEDEEVVEVAQAYLDEVRARAFGVEVENLGVHAKPVTLENLLDEYRYEFAMEGHRFFDLVRFDKAQEVLGTKGYTASKRYLPIPQSEIDRAEGTLKQNTY